MPRKADVDAGGLVAVLARAFPCHHTVEFERTADGVSTQMYRLTHESEVFYLRIAEEDGENLRVDAEIQSHLRGLGVRVPEVVYVEQLASELQRSVLVMREVPGIPLALVTDPDVARDAARHAGRDAAAMNAVPVNGFGWIHRSAPVWPPRSPIPDYHAFASENIPDGVEERRQLLHGLFEDHELEALDDVILTEGRRPLDQASLAHGDLDVTAIYVNEGAYSGLIDLGELRGGEPEFDLGHFLLHDQETNSISLFDAFRRGYDEAHAGDLDDDQIRRVAILVGLRQLCRSEARGLQRSWFAKFRAAQLLNLLEGKPACAPRPH